MINYFLFAHDPLSCQMAVLIVAVFGPVFLYTAGGTNRMSWADRAFLTGILLSCLGTVFAAHWLTFIFFFEMVSLFVYLLLRRNQHAVCYLAIQLACGTVLILAATALFLETGDVEPGAIPAVLLPYLVIGLGAKSAIWGLHFWLPPLHAEAPGPVSAVLSGVTVKLGVYGILRLILSTPHAGLSVSLTVIGIFMIFWGSIYALSQEKPKLILAYSTISNLGYLFAGLGGASRIVPLFYALAHGTVKAALFVGTDILTKHQTSGALRHFLVGSMAVLAAALAGLPPFPLYVAKRLTKSTLGHPLLPFLAGILTAVYLVKFLVLTLNQEVSGYEQPEATRVGAFTALILGAFILPFIIFANQPEVIGYLLSPGKLGAALIDPAIGILLFVIFQRWICNLPGLPDIDHVFGSRVARRFIVRADNES